MLYIRGLHGGADKAGREIAPEVLTMSVGGTKPRYFSVRQGKAPLSGSPQSGEVWGPRRKNFRWGHNEHALRGKGAIARKQTESRFFKRLSCSLARIATRERTRTYVSIHDGDLDAVSRKIARDGVPHVLSRNGTLNRLIRMRCAKAPPGRTRGVLVVHKRSARRG